MLSGCRVQIYFQVSEQGQPPKEQKTIQRVLVLRRVVALFGSCLFLCGTVSGDKRCAALSS